MLLRLRIFRQSGLQMSAVCFTEGGRSMINGHLANTRSVTLDHFVMVRIHARQFFMLRYLQKISQAHQRTGSQLVANFWGSNPNLDCRPPVHDKTGQYLNLHISSVDSSSVKPLFLSLFMAATSAYAGRSVGVGPRPLERHR